MNHISIPAIVYFDHNSTTSPEPEVLEFFNTVASHPLNPSSIHAMGRFASSLIEKARKQIREACCLDNQYNVYFTSTGTEANNLLMHNFRASTVFISAIEHASLMVYKEYGAHVIKVDSQGKLNLQHLEDLLASANRPLPKLAQSEAMRGANESTELPTRMKFSEDASVNGDGRALTPKLVSIMLANNETGVVQDLESISKITKKFNAILHTDASQALGRISLENLRFCDCVTVCGHKIGGISGAAALVCRKNIIIKAQIIGGGQEQYARSGTENVVAIGAFGLAASIVSKTQQDRKIIVQTMRDTLEERLLELKPNIIIASRQSLRLPNTSLIMIPEFSAQRLLIELDLRKIAVSSGAACSSGKVQKSHVLEAMGFTQELLSCALRISLSHNNSMEHVNYFIKNLSEIIRGTVAS
ncbi:Cysteine desulfurase [Rickettsiales endosymbiont of Paramecium tredecaurelia]|uniref:cysteine desulfurase family protein n=1 Tax=Candidatus Sarmatiella mevalonica TaxID=2770581 RepID=UPI001923F28F|nr:cysteine desulfurase family protein [Candidatus Sarmatiella mevalonica]MBL3284698.1 Cysteine desulfurase [Candidatus Sarmatiella mevalonica]